MHTKLTYSQVRRLNKFWAAFDMKFCNDCGTTKEFAEFNKGGTDPTTGRALLQNSCRNCQKVENSHWRGENAELARAHRISYRLGGRDPNKPWPDADCSYDTAHGRVEAVYGLA